MNGFNLYLMKPIFVSIDDGKSFGNSYSNGYSQSFGAISIIPEPN